ncbi:MAG: Anti-sigma factor antagonist [Actinomycetia bacterium]|nr:Anti-sigma factor antagonist [Actinomycetes bacterium]
MFAQPWIEPTSATLPSRRSTGPRRLRKTVLVLEGELDIGDAVELGRRLQWSVQSSAVVEVDLRQVTFVDCGILGVFVAAQNFADDLGVAVIVRSPQPPVRKMLEITGLSARFQIE